MRGALNVGDRVRVAVASHESGYRYGDKGTVQRVEDTRRGVRYHVAMDKAGRRSQEEMAGRNPKPYSVSPA